MDKKLLQKFFQYFFYLQLMGIFYIVCLIAIAYIDVVYAVSLAVIFILLTIILWFKITYYTYKLSRG